MNTKNLSLLYAEDEGNVRADYKLYMQLYFNTIYEAKDGEEALRLYHEKKPDIIILDIVMPKVDGLLVAQNIRELDEQTPIIILTAHSDKTRLLKAIQLGLVDYLIKPIDRQNLKAALQKAFERLRKNHTNNLLCLQEEPCLSVDITSGLLYKNNVLQELSKYEVTLLKLFVTHKNQVLSKVNIFNTVWDEPEKHYSDAGVRNLVKKLRKHLPEGIIENIYGGGYIFKLP